MGFIPFFYPGLITFAIEQKINFIISYSDTKISNQGLIALGSYIKRLKRLTNLELFIRYLRYFFKETLVF
jgi:hypothetical protein